MDNLKFTIRVGHLMSSAALSCFVVLNYISEGNLEKKLEKQDEVNWKTGFLMCSVFSFGSGVMHIFLTKGDKELKDPVHGIWLHLFELKFLLSMFLTPMVYPLTSLFAEEGENNVSEQTIIKIQFYIVVFLAFYSTFAKYFREEVCQNFEVDLVMEKVQELQNRYDQSTAKPDGPLETEEATPLGGKSKIAGAQKSRSEQVEEEKQWMARQQESFMKSKRTEQLRAHKQAKAGQTGGTDDPDIKRQLREIREKEAILNQKLNQFSSFAGPVPGANRKFQEDQRPQRRAGRPMMGTEEDPIIESDEDAQVRRFREEDVNEAMLDDVYGEEIGSSDDDIPDLDDVPAPKKGGNPFPMSQEDIMLKKMNEESEAKLIEKLRKQYKK